MKKIVLILINLMIVFSLSCSMMSFATTTGSAKLEDRWLTLSKNSTGARYIVNAKGAPSPLFGMARAQVCAARDEDPIYMGIDGLSQHFKELGSNSMRLAIALKDINGTVDYVEECGGYNEKGIQKYITQYVDPDVQGIINAGMYVNLDLHDYPPASAPEEKIKYAREHYIPIWRELAKRYKNEPMIAMFELWNEPYPADQSSIGVDGQGIVATGPNIGYDWSQGVRNFYIDCISEVRKYDQKHMILVSDYNAGWGTAWPVTWAGHTKEVDPVYQNTTFSIHIATAQLDTTFSFYGDWWAKTSSNSNVCFILGEIETEGDLMTKVGMENMVKMFDNYEKTHYYSGYLWRPHTDEANYVSVWKDFAKRYTTTIQQSRWVIEAETSNDKDFEKIENFQCFGKRFTATAVKINSEAKSKSFGEIFTRKVYPAGTYEIRVRGLGDKINTAEIAVGYTTPSGKLIEISSIKSRNTEEFYEDIFTFTTEEKIVNFALIKKGNSNNDSNLIDRITLRTDKAITTEKPESVKISSVSNIITDSKIDGTMILEIYQQQL